MFMEDPKQLALALLLFFQIKKQQEAEKKSVRREDK